MAASQSQLRYALALDQGFQGRLQSIFAKIAVQVEAESSGGNLVARQAFAKKVLTNPARVAADAAFYMIFTDNFVGATIDIIPVEGSRVSVVVSTSDADAESQVFSVWDKLAALFG